MEQPALEVTDIYIISPVGILAKNVSAETFIVVVFPFTGIDAAVIFAEFRKAHMPQPRSRTRGKIRAGRPVAGIKEFVIFPDALFIDTAIGKVSGGKAVELVISEFADILHPIGIVIDPLPVVFAVEKPADIFFAIGENIGSPAMRKTIPEFTDIFVAVGKGQIPLPVVLVVSEGTNVFFTIGE